mgnify:CR=1 FL=1
MNIRIFTLVILREFAATAPRLTVLNLRRQALCLFLSFGLAGLAPVSGQVNSWTNLASGFWEVGGNWSLGIPPNSNHTVVIDNAVAMPPFSKAVSITAATTNVPASMTISNLRLGGGFVQNTLRFDNAGTGLPFWIRGYLALSNTGHLVVDNSRVVVSGVPGSGEGIVVDGSMTLHSGAFTYENESATGMAVGRIGRGRVFIHGGKFTSTGSTYIRLGSTNGTEGVLTISGGEADIRSQFVHLGATADSTGTVWLSGADLTTFFMSIGYHGAGRMTVSNGTWRSNNGVEVGSQSGSDGTLTILGGTNSFFPGLALGTWHGGMGKVRLLGGSLITTNTFIGYFGTGHMTMSNATWLTQSLTVGGISGDGVLVVDGGIIDITDGFGVGYWSTTNTAHRLFLINGGHVRATNKPNISAVNYGSSLILSNGLLHTSDFFVYGRHRIDGGTHLMDGSTMNIGIATFPITTGSVRMAGGQLLNPGGTNLIIMGSMTQHAGVVQSEALVVGNDGGYGIFSIEGGVHRVGSGGITIAKGFNGRGHMDAKGGATSSDGLIVGDCLSVSPATFFMNGGDVYITNAAQTAVMDVRNGLVLLLAGTMKVDTLIITNSCALFVWTGGNLSYKNLVLDPELDADGDGMPNGWEIAHGLNPLISHGIDGANADPDGDGFTNIEEFRRGSHPLIGEAHITGFALEGNNARVYWQALGGRTTMLQSVSFTNGGVIIPHHFVDLPPPVVMSGTNLATTNRLVIGGATNYPSRMYRVRSVP